MTRMCWTGFVTSVRRAALAVGLAVAAMVPEAMASGYEGHGGSYHYNSGGYRPDKTISYHSSSGYRGGGSSSGSRTRTYSSRYRSGGSGYSWLSNWNRGSTNNGYSGPNTSVSTPHRSDWLSKLQAQRTWDEQQFRKMQQADQTNVRCGLSNAPAYCYRLKGPYPKEMYVVRY